MDKPYKRIAELDIRGSAIRVTFECIGQPKDIQKPLLDEELKGKIINIKA